MHGEISNFGIKSQPTYTNYTVEKMENIFTPFKPV